MDREAIAAFMQHHITSRLGDLNGVCWDNAFKSKRACTVRDFSQYWLQTKEDVHRYANRIPSFNGIGMDPTYSKLLANLEKKEKIVMCLDGILVPEFVQQACRKVFKDPKSLVSNYVAIQELNAELYLRYESRSKRGRRVRELEAINRVLQEYVKALTPVVEEFYLPLER